MNEQQELPAIPTQPQPRYFRFDRRTVGMMDLVKELVTSSAIGTLGFGVGAQEWVPGVIGILLGLLRVGLSFLLKTSEVTNPL